jgi:uncharacterized membrane protein
MSRISQTIDVAVPVRVAYDQWTQFESFPEFMDGVERVVQVDDVTVDWTASIAGRTKQWRAKITDQEPDTLIAWRSVDGARNDGRVEFESLGTNSTRVMLELVVEPEGALESAGDALGLVEGRVKGDLERFKTFIEGRQVATGAWRGEVEGGKEVAGGAGAGSRPTTSHDDVLRTGN